MRTPTRIPAQDVFSKAEAAFKNSAAKPVAEVAKPPSIPGARELVSLRIDKDVLEHFQADGPGWQERINEALRRSIQA